MEFLKYTIHTRCRIMRMTPPTLSLFQEAFRCHLNITKCSNTANNSGQLVVRVRVKGRRVTALHDRPIFTYQSIPNQVAIQRPHTHPPPP